MISVQTVSLFYALLAIVANLLVIGAVAFALTGRLDRLRDVFGPSALPAAYAVALLATAGSLYFSEVAHFEPCRLCWYQRIAMYPLVVVVGIAALRRDHDIRRYVIPVAGIGASIAAYHYTIEWLPWLDSGVCSASVPCTVVWFRQLGFISLPYLALSAFLAIIVLVWLSSDRRTAPDGLAHPAGSIP